MPDVSAADALRQAWRALPAADSFAGRLARRSLEASARQDPALESVLFELQHRFQSELDLHLEGEEVREHATTAVDFANLVSGIADAVKELTKVALGRERMPATLQILAPTPGSVRVVLQPVPPAEDADAFEATETETRESQSLVTVAAILARAGEAGGDAVLDALAAGVPVAAHTGLRRAAKAVVASQWSVVGTLRQARQDPVMVQVDSDGANRLLDALDARVEEEHQTQLRGRIDGQRRSLGAMWFLPVTGAPFEAAVPEPKLLARVAALAADDDLVQATFTVVIRTPAGVSAGARRSYSLTTIDAIQRDTELPIEDV